MARYIELDALIAEIEKWKQHTLKCGYAGQGEYEEGNKQGRLDTCEKFLYFLDTLEVKEVDLYNNGWIDCTKQMPPETKQTSDTLQGHREWTESDVVLAWDSSYGCRVDFTKNGKWMSEQRGGYTGQLIHGIIAWRPIPEFSEELLLKAQKGE